MFKKTANGGAMGFFHMDGFIPSYRQAAKFAGKNGHVGTMLDVVDARLATLPLENLNQTDPSNPTPWDQYYTTMSAEYFGVSKGGVKILIVTHGVGPMSNEQGVVAAYKWQTSDKTRSRHGGRISAEEFHRLEEGHYGPVEVVEIKPYLSRYKYPFISILRASEAREDPVVRARLGPRAGEYLAEHERLALEYYRQVHCAVVFNIEERSSYKMEIPKMDPFMIQVGHSWHCSYERGAVEDGMAFAHLLSIGQISLMRGVDYGRLPTWSSEINPHDWGDGTRMFGVREGCLTSIRKGPDARKLLRSHWRELFESSGLDCEPGGPYVLMEMPDGTWFVQIPKKGARVDTYEPEFRVTSMEKVGESARFYTESNYPVPIFRYDRREALAVLPEGANAYALVGDPERVGGADDRETCLVQGYRVEIDHTQRLIRQKVLANDFDRMMQLSDAA